MTQTDEFCEVYDAFMEMYNEGMEVPDITASILKKYHSEFDDDDGVMHDVYFAIAKAEWMCCSQSDMVLQRVRDIIESDSNIDFYRELEATEADLKVRRKNLYKFLESLSTPRKTPRKRVPPPKPESEPACLDKGDFFWYRSNSAVYGGLILEKLAEELTGKIFLVALTERLESIPKTTDDILNAPAYTVAWAVGLLPEKRTHYVGKIEITDKYNGRAGAYISKSLSYCENNMYDRTWKHEGRNLEFDGVTVRDLLDESSIPDSFDHSEHLMKSIDQMKQLCGEDSVVLL